MSFPGSFSGALTLRDATVAQALARVESALDRERAFALQRSGSAIHFRGGVFRLVSGWNVLAAVSSGVVEMAPAGSGVQVRYRVAFTQLLVVVTGMVAFFLGPFVMMSPGPSMAGRLGILAFMWIWLFGANYALTRWRFPRFLRRAVEPASVRASVQPGA